jgi:hypothetical protein
MAEPVKPLKVSNVVGLHLVERAGTGGSRTIAAHKEAKE